MKITATNLQRHMNCNGSSLMDKPEPIEKEENKVRDEGIAADWVIEQIYNGYYTAEEIVNKKSKNNVFITAEMVSYLNDYLTSLNGARIEVNTDWNDTLNCEITGRADKIKYDAEKQNLEVGDFKYGYTIVEPENNWTLISHAIGWYIDERNTAHFEDRPEAPIKTITFSIYQPRPSHYLGKVRTHTITFDELMSYIPIIIQAVKHPQQKLNTGEHCKNCPLVATCPASRKAGNNGIDATERLFNEKISNDDLDYELDLLQRSIKLLEGRKKAFEELAVARLKKGQVISNRLLDVQLANTSWKKHITPEIIEALVGKDISEKKLVTPTQAKNVYGIDEAVIATFTERAVKGVKMVRVDANTKAQKIFNQK